jgi:uncharacterized membrane protein
MKKYSAYLMGLLYVVAGFNHFRAPAFYLPGMPPWIPAHDWMIALSGVAEILLGSMIFYPLMRRFAAWGVILMLIVFLNVHVYMLMERNTVFADVPAWILVARLPVQGLLILWAWVYTREGETAAPRDLAR